MRHVWSPNKALYTPLITLLTNYTFHKQTINNNLVLSNLITCNQLDIKIYNNTLLNQNSQQVTNTDLRIIIHDYLKKLPTFTKKNHTINTTFKGLKYIA